jgi:hypothetical protein
MTQTFSAIDLVDQIKTILSISDDFNFSILVEMNPIKKRYSYLAKVLSIITKTKDEKPQFIHYDKILEHELNYLEIKENHIRKVGIRKTPFFIDGSSAIQTYTEHEFVEYSLRNPTKTELRRIDKLRTKYNISVPHQFIGQKLTFDDSDFEL